MKDEIPKLRIELDVCYIDLKSKISEILEKAQNDFFYMDDVFYLIKNGYEEMWYTKNKKSFSVILAVSKKGNIELYHSFKENLIKSGRNKQNMLIDSLPVILEVDAILDKINKYGIELITKEEKNFLDKSYK